MGTFLWWNLSPSQGHGLALSVNGRTMQKYRMVQDQSGPGYCVYMMCVQPSLVQAPSQLSSGRQSCVNVLSASL